MKQLLKSIGKGIVDTCVIVAEAHDHSIIEKTDLSREMKDVCKEAISAKYGN